jgi:serine/threonine-protein kinase PknG
VPDTSSQYVAAQLAAVEAALLGRAGRDVGESELRAAAARVQQLNLDPGTDRRVRARLLTAAVDLDPAGGLAFLDSPWEERHLRFALEECLRASARLTGDRAERIELVDRANAVRPRTWV